MKNIVNKWFVAEVVCAPDATEAVESAFNVLDVLGTEIDSLRKAKGRTVVRFGLF